MNDSKQAETPPAPGSSGESAARAGSSPPSGSGSGSADAPSPASGESSSEAPSQQELAIRSALETVMDPELGLSVIDLGLIREVQVDEGKTQIRMMLTTPFCPYAPQMIQDVKQAAQGVIAQETEVEILPDAWSPDLMPDPGLLGFSY